MSHSLAVPARRPTSILATLLAVALALSLLAVSARPADVVDLGGELPPGLSRLLDA